MENRRRFPRFENACQIKYCLPNGSGRFGYTIANDISRGGLSMPALSIIAKNGDILKLDINNNDGKGSISAMGKVRWVRKLKRNALLDEVSGIEFLDIADTDIDRLIKT